jgi:hypothetical protein
MAPRIEPHLDLNLVRHVLGFFVLESWHSTRKSLDPRRRGNSDV